MNKFVSASALYFSAAAFAHAELPTGLSTAITAAGTDSKEVGAAVLLVLVGIMAYKWIRKAF